MNNTSNIAAVILAAGKGKRMKSDLPKVLHKLKGKYLVDHVIDNARKAKVGKLVVIVGHKHELVREKLADRKVEFALQEPQLGTGHAIQMALPALSGFSGDLLVLCGDMPLITSDTITKIIKMRRETDSAATVLTVKMDDPGSYGRIVRNPEGFLEGIVEFKDASPEVKKINEINTGAYCFDYEKLISVLDKLSSENAQREYYLTETIELFNKQGLKVSALISDNPNEGMGVNSKEELSLMESLVVEH